MLSSVIAVLGTLAGATATYVFQRRITDHNEVIARAERMRQERLAACSAFAAAVMELRRVQYDLWHRRHEHSQQVDSGDVRDDSYRLRSTAWSAYYRFRITTTDAQLTTLGWSAVDQTAQVARATDEADLRSRGERARELLEEFVVTAAHHFQR